MQSALPFVLFVVFSCASSTSRAIFMVWDCVKYEFSGTENHFFLRRELTVRCNSDDHRSMAITAYVLMAVWPFGSVLLFFSLALRARARLLSHRYDSFLHATSFLHRDFKPQAWFWAALELLHREVITGWVLLVPAGKSFIRTIVGLLASLVFLVLTIVHKPYKRVEDNALAVAAQLLQVVLFIGCILMKTFEDTAAEDPQLAIRVLGFSSTSEIVTMLLVFMFLMLVVLLISALYAMRRDAVVPTFRLQGTGLPPELTLKAGQRYHGFVSHAWSTAQDAAATIKRQLQRMLPSVRLFLDVDDLRSIDELEQYVKESASMQLFLSKDYLQSRNCLREVVATLDQAKPFQLVHEVDPQKGGAPLKVFKEELQDETRRAALFKEGVVLTEWHRTADQQVVSLTLIAQEMLRSTPAY